MRPLRLSLPVLALFAADAAAQIPLLRVTLAARPGGTITTLVQSPNLGYLTLVDVTGGPHRLLGEDLYLGLTPSLTVLDQGTGSTMRTYSVPATVLPGLQLYFQSFVLDPAAPNGMFRATDGESTAVYLATNVMEVDVRDRANNDFSGSYDRTILGRLVAAPVTRRVATYVPNAARFGLPVAGEIGNTGVRTQRVYRAVDLGATGRPEVLTAIHWEAFRGQPLADDVLPRMTIDASHSKVVPDFTIDPLSAFPRFPDSGLSARFADNPSDAPVRVFAGAYAIRASASSGGFVPYPALQQEFVYDGTSSLLLDFATDPVPLSAGVNGQQVYVMVTTSPRPNARAISSGTTRPSLEVQALRADNAQTGMRFEFASVHSEALSLWLPAPKASPDYQSPYVNASVPPGASVAVEYRGTSSPTAQPTAWSHDVNVADGLPFLQIRVVFRAAVDGGRPSVDGFVIPVN